MWLHGNTQWWLQLGGWLLVVLVVVVAVMGGILFWPL
jgi:hypothetical protein